jgi:hypothetical protein
MNMTTPARFPATSPAATSAILFLDRDRRTENNPTELNATSVKRKSETAPTGEVIGPIPRVVSHGLGSAALISACRV